MNKTDKEKEASTNDLLKKIIKLLELRKEQHKETQEFIRKMQTDLNKMYKRYISRI